jgi:hypothetical protein
VTSITKVADRSGIFMAYWSRLLTLVVAVS